MSEWGNPVRVKPHHSFIGEPTQGIETSQYLEEEKSNEIALVAASERARAQTSSFRGAGVVGRQRGQSRPNEIVSRSELERSATEGESPVGEAKTRRMVAVPE